MASKPQSLEAAIEGDAWLDDYIPYRLYRTTNRLNSKLLARLKVINVSPSQWRVLSVLKAHGTLRLTEIVELTLMEQPTISRVVVQMEKKQQVKRESSTTDSRVTYISLTRKGVKSFEEIAPSALEHQRIAFKGISKKEIKVLVDILSRVEGNITL